MAQGEKKFSHITVTSDEDDDFVIQAGVPAGSRSAAPDEAQAAREDEAAGEASAQGGEAGDEAGREDDAAAEADGVERADEAIADEEADGPFRMPAAAPLRGRERRRTPTARRRWRTWKPRPCP